MDSLSGRLLTQKDYPNLPLEDIESRILVMKKTLYLKFLLAYLIFGIFGFIVVSTFSPGMVRDHFIKENAERLYSECVPRGRPMVVPTA